MAPPTEVLPDIYRIQLPVPRNRPGFVNVYLIRGEEGSTLVDAGWDMPEGLQALQEALDTLGVAMAEIRLLVVTHIHPDHYGMACRVQRLSGASLAMHHEEWDYLESRYAAPERLLTEMPEWFRWNGAPEAMIESLLHASHSMLAMVGVCYPDRALSGGERIRCGRYEFEVIWTPGHTDGHICLYDARARAMISGDHLLATITTNISALKEGQETLLGDFLDSLRLISGLEVETIMPGHGLPFTGLACRVQEVLAHHEERLLEMLEQVPAEGGASAHEVARGTRWRSGRAWSELATTEQRLAVMETIAHLDHLCRRGQARRSRSNGLILYHRKEVAHERQEQPGDN